MATTDWTTRTMGAHVIGNVEAASRRVNDAISEAPHPDGGVAAWALLALNSERTKNP
jgi:hypothetical protein